MRQGIALLLTVAAFLGPALNPGPDADVWWHLRAGSEILDGKPSAFNDSWSFTAFGKEWINHEWLAQVLLALARRAGGDRGVVLLSAAVLLLTAGLLFRAARLEGLGPGAAACLVCLGALSIEDRFVPRPHIFTYLSAALFLERLAACRRGSPVWTLPLVQVFWTNVHGPVPGLVLETCLIFGGGLPGRSLKARGLVWLACLAASVVHPQGVQVLTGSLLHLSAGGLYRQTIREWLPLQHRAQRELAQGPASWALLGIGLAIAIRGLAGRDRGRCPGYILFLSAVSLAPLLAVRHRDLLAIGLAPLAAVILKPDRRGPSRPGSLLDGTGMGLALAFLLIPGLGWLGYTRLWPPRPGLSETGFPAAAVDFLKQHDLGRRIFNAYDYGGYLVDRVRRDRFIFIDGRYFIYGEELYREYLEARDGGPGALAILARHDVDVLLVRYPQPDGYQGLARVVRESPEWALVFWDDQTLIYARRARTSPEWLLSREYRWVDPTVPAKMEDPGYWTRNFREIAREARRAQSEAPGAANPLLLEGLAHEYGGDDREAARLFGRVLRILPANRPAREGLRRIESRIPRGDPRP